MLLKNGLRNKLASLRILYYKLELDYKDRCKINVSIHTLKVSENLMGMNFLKLNERFEIAP
jgi:hypothetical protein